MLHNISRLAVISLVALNTGVSLAESELDPIQSPEAIVRRVDPKTKTITSYRVPEKDDSFSPAAISRLTQAEKKAKIEAFIKSVEKPENKISVEKVEKLALPTSELDRDESNNACWFGWWGFNNYNYNSYGYNYNYYSYGSGMLRPYWGWGFNPNGGCGGGFNPYYMYYGRPGCW